MPDLCLKRRLVPLKLCDSMPVAARRMWKAEQAAELIEAALCDEGAQTPLDCLSERDHQRVGDDGQFGRELFAYLACEQGAAEDRWLLSAVVLAGDKNGVAERRSPVEQSDLFGE